MRKTLIRILSIIGAAIMCFSMVGCKKEDPTLSSEDVIQLYYWKSGYGVKFMERVVNEFNESQDKYTVKLEYDSDASVILRTLDLGETNTYDLYFTMVQNMSQMRDNIVLDDILDYKADGEDVTIREKYDPSVLEAQKTPAGEIKSLSYGSGLCGIIYNSAMISEDQLPRTTKELQLLVVELQNKDNPVIKDKKIVPWLFYNNPDTNGYWNFAANAWAAQYEGLDYYYDTMLKAGATGEEKFDVNYLTKKDGRYEALKVLESVITPKTVHPEVTSSNFTKVQSLFLNGEAAMIMNGSWMLNENRKDVEVAMMKMPVISSIVNKLDYRDADGNVMDDNVLAEIISEVDEGATSTAYEGVSQKDFDRIKEARNMMYVNSAREFVFIPRYSPAIEGAKEFLKYFYSDKGILCFMETLNLPATVHLSDPSKFDTTNSGMFQQRQFDLWKTVVPVTSRLSQSALYNDTGMDPFLNLSFTQRMCAANPKDRKNADVLWDDLVKNVNANAEEWR